MPARQIVVILVLLFVGEVGLQAQPTFLFPPNGPGQTGLPTNFTLRVSRLGGFLRLYDIELSKDISFSPTQSSPDYQGQIFSFSRNFTVNNLVVGERYYIRTRSWALFQGFTPYRLDSVFIFVPPLIPPSLELVDGIDATIQPIYANKEIYDLVCTNVSGANEYNWQFDIEGDFVTPEFELSSGSNSITVNTTDLISGQTYFVRIQARNIYSGDMTLFANSTPVQYYNSLHPLSLALYGNTIDRRSFKLWADVVTNGGEYIFQVASDPGFSNIFTNPDFPETQDSWPGVSGVVFKANRDWYQGSGWDVSPNPIIYKSFDFVKNLNSGQLYYFRVRAANTNQLGYWGPVHQILVDPPSLSIDIERVSHGSAGLNDLDVYFVFTLAPNFDLTFVDFQLALDNGFNNLVFNGSMLTNTRSLRLPSINYATTYYARVRAYASNYPASPSAWSPTTTFSTQMNPFPANISDLEIVLPKSNSFTENGLKNEIAAYPNPFSRDLTLHISDEAEFVRVYDANGILLINQEQVQRGSFRIGENLPIGLYVLKIGFKNRLEQLKLIKSN